MTPIRTILVAAVTLGTLAASGQAGATSLAVKMACAADYYSNCSRHSLIAPASASACALSARASPGAASTL